MELSCAGRPKDAEIEEAASIDREGWSMAELGKMFGVDPATVWRRLRTADVKLRPPWSPRKPHMF
jgi:DNA-directed RNA polymerase specialized sigma24 family protein